MPLPTLEAALAERQQRFYGQAGLDAFAGTVPFRLSTSRAMARLVADAALTFAQHQHKARVRIVDVGAGSGRLGFHLHDLDERLHVVLTDASLALVDAWRAHPQLSTSPRLSFVHAPATALGPALEHAPDEALVVIGTYLLDTLPHALVEAPSGRRAFVKPTGELVFGPAPLDTFTRAWLHRLQHGRAFVPVGAFELLRCVERDVREPTLALFADKAARTVDEAREGDPPRLVAHGAGASVLVNLAALRAWLGWRDWREAPGGSNDFVVGATVLRRGGTSLPNLFQNVAHPLDVQAHVTATRSGPDVTTRVLALAPDADVLLELADALVVEASHGLPEPQRAALGAWLLDTARGAFFLPADDVPFHAGRVLHRLGFAHAAVACFSTSLERHGDLVVTRLHRALSLAALDARAHALADLHEVLRREPTHPEALRLVAQLA